MYNVKTATVDQIKSMLQNGDDNKNNWVCVFVNGDIELISGPRPSMDGLLYKLSSFAAGNHYVGPTVDDNMIILLGEYFVL